jgi:hypothetical protein
LGIGTVIFDFGFLIFDPQDRRGCDGDGGLGI